MIRRGDPEGLQFHAWNIDAEGRVIDTTWDDDGIAYLGVVVDKATMTSLLEHRGTYFKVTGYEGSRIGTVGDE